MDAMDVPMLVLIAVEMIAHGDVLYCVVQHVKLVVVLNVAMAVVVAVLISVLDVTDVLDAMVVQVVEPVALLHVVQIVKQVARVVQDVAITVPADAQDVLVVVARIVKAAVEQLVVHTVALGVPVVQISVVLHA